MSQDPRISRNKWVAGLLGSGVFLSGLTTVVVFFLMAKESFEFFGLIQWQQFFLDTEWEPLLEPKRFGVWPLISGTLMVGVGAMLLAVPAGVLCAIHLSEYSSQKTRNLLKPVLEILAGVPTVVYGYFALTFLTPWLQGFIPSLRIFNALSATIVVAIMILPMISSLTDDALQALPKSLKEGAYSLGATSFEVAKDILIPAASGRIIASVLLAFSRAIGETMAVALAAGATPRLEWNFLESIQTMTAFIVQVSLGDTPAGGVEYLSAFAVGTLLFLITLVLNGIGSFLIVRSAKELQ